MPAPDAVLDDDYGDGESIVLLRPGSPPTPVSVDEVRICDLRDILDGGGNVIGWNHEAAVPAGTIGLDPERGRVLLGAPPTGRCWRRSTTARRARSAAANMQRTPEGDDLAAAQLVGERRGAAAGARRRSQGGGRLLIGDSLTYAQDAGLQGRRRHRTPARRAAWVVVAAHELRRGR